MNDEHEIATEGPDERELGERLRTGRPVPAAGFRDGLGQRLAALDPGYGPRPAGLRRIVAAGLGAGLVLIAVGALAAIGVL